MKRIIVRVILRIAASASLLVILTIACFYFHEYQLQNEFRRADLITVEGVSADTGQKRLIVLSEQSNPEIFDQFKHLCTPHGSAAETPAMHSNCVITVYRGLPPNTEPDAKALSQLAKITTAVYLVNDGEIGVPQDYGTWYSAPKPLYLFMRRQFLCSDIASDVPLKKARSDPRARAAPSGIFIDPSGKFKDQAHSVRM